MTLLPAALITIGATAVAVTAMLLVRRRAPEGSFFSDGDRASGVFGVLATGFSVLLGFIVFLSFTSFDESRSGAEQEALAVAQQIQTAQFFPRQVAPELTGELVCYARSIIHDEWDRMEQGTQGEAVNVWGVRLFESLRTVEPRTASEQSAYDKWLDETSAREEARIDRIHGAVGVIPTPLWIVLFFIGAVIFVYVLFFADSGERAVVQGFIAGAVTATMTALLLLLGILDNPFHEGVGGLQPTAMERTLAQFEDAARRTDLAVEIPCDALGAPEPT